VSTPRDEAALRRLNESLQPIGIDPFALPALDGSNGMIPHMTVTGSALVSQMNLLGRRLDPIGWRPVCLGDEDDVAMVERTIDEDPRATPEILAAAATIDGDVSAWAKRRLANKLREFREHGVFSETELAQRERRWVDRHGDPEQDFPKTPKPDPGPFPAACFNSDLEHTVTVVGTTGELQPATRYVWKKRVVLGLVATNLGWQIPAYLSFGGWNDCPLAEEHAWFHHQWEAEYGAQVAVVTHDTIETMVPRPPTTRAAAIALARQQFDYCEDIVKQSVGSVGALAGGLLDCPFWYFWWD
jgi:hypothetical protein